VEQAPNFKPEELKRKINVKTYPDKGVDDSSEDYYFSSQEIGNAVRDALLDINFLTSILRSIFSDRDIEHLMIDAVNISEIQSGLLQYIFEVRFNLNDGTSRSCIIATSKGLYTPEAAEKILEHQFPEVKTSPMKPLYAVHLQRLMENQVRYDSKILPYLRKVSEERQLPYLVPETYAFTTHYVHSKRTRNEIPISFLAMEKLNAPEGGYGGEINPAWYTYSAIPLEGPPYFWRMNAGKSSSEWNDRVTNGYTEDKAHMMMLAEEKNAEVLAYIYYSTGKLPYWFSNAAGDFLLFVKKLGVPVLTDLIPALITARGSLYPLGDEVNGLRFVPGRNDSGRMLVPEQISKLAPRGMEVQDRPDIRELIIALSWMTITPNYFEYGDQQDIIHVEREVPVFSDRRNLVAGVVEAFHRFYGHDANIGDYVTIFKAGSIPSLEQGLMLSGIISEESDLQAILPLMGEIDHFAQNIVQVLNTARTIDLSGTFYSAHEVQSAMEGHNTRPLTVMISNDVGINEEILKTTFGEPVERRPGSIEGSTIIVYRIQPQDVGGKENVYLEVVTMGGKVAFQVYQKAGK
jgi:hypothetical protein